MSQEAEQIVRGLFAALATGDMAAVDALFGDEVRFTTGGDSPLAGLAVGKTQVFEKLGKIAAMTDGTARLELVACYGAGPELALAHVRRHASARGETVEADAAMVVRVEDGKIVEVADVMETRLAAFWTHAST